MNIFEGLEEYEIKNILDRLLPRGIDAAVALKVLYELSPSSVSLLNAELAEEAEKIPIEVLDRLPFKLHSLTSKEERVLDAYCTYIVLKFYR